MQAERRNRRRARISQKVRGSAQRPRVTVHRSAHYTDVQLIDDEQGKTIVAVSGKTVSGDSKVTQARAVGQQLAEAAVKAGVKKVVFDRAGYKYHGRVKAVADGLRAGGLEL